MIARYTRPEMEKIWSERNRYRLWLKVEMAVCHEMAKEGIILPKEWKELRTAVENYSKKGGVNPDRVEFHEKITRHDVIAFTHVLSENLGETARFIHFGLTSSDVVDTALSIQIAQAGELLLQDIDQLLAILSDLAKKNRDLPTIGRSHGIFAEPTSFGLKFLGWRAEWLRNRQRLETALDGIRFGKLSGAVGVNAHWSPESETCILGRLGLSREPVSTQVIPRDRHAEIAVTLALCGSSMERIAIELRHLQRSEVGEVLEGFKSGQKGSSAMPHKRNPISSENLTGCARLLRSYAQVALENIALWHERDISHSAVERVALPDSCILLDYALNRLSGVLKNLVIRQPQIAANLKKAGTAAYSGHFLLELVRKGVAREQAYAWVQECALASLEGKGGFTALIEQHAGIRSALSVKEIKKLGSLKYQLRNVKEIFAKAWGNSRQ